MQHYYVERNPNIQGRYRVHRDGCSRLPALTKERILGCSEIAMERLRKPANPI